MKYNLKSIFQPINLVAWETSNINKNLFHLVVLTFKIKLKIIVCQVTKIKVQLVQTGN
jgi:hypothetical protein